MGAIVFCDDHQATRQLIQAMDDSRPFNPADSRKPFAMVQESVNKRALAISGRGVHDQPDGFIEHEKAFVFINNVQVDCLRAGLSGNRRWALQFDPVAGAHCRTGFRFDVVVDSDATFPHKTLDGRSRMVWQLHRQPAIQALALCFLPHRKAFDFGFTRHDVMPIIGRFAGTPTRLG